MNLSYDWKAGLVIDSPAGFRRVKMLRDKHDRIRRQGSNYAWLNFCGWKHQRKKAEIASGADSSLENYRVAMC